MLRHLSETRRKILEHLKRQGPMTADELARALSITAMGVRQHLVNLERDGWVRYRTRQRGKGRPSYVFSLTPQGDELFPRTYPQLADSLIDAARRVYGAEGLVRLFAQRNERLKARYRRRLGDKALSDKVAELACLRSEEGYMAEWEQLDEATFRLHERNCAICRVAQRCQDVCRFELELFRQVLPEATVSREEHLIQGDQTCTYLIRHQRAS